MFNATYSLALFFLADKLRTGGALAVFKRNGKTFWATDVEAEQVNEEFADVTFVDDECL